MAFRRAFQQNGFLHLAADTRASTTHGVTAAALCEALKRSRLFVAVGGDGFLINPPFGLTRRYVTSITEGLVPALQRRGLTRTAYATKTLREHLLEF